MPSKLSTTIKKIDMIQNRENSNLIKQFQRFMISNGSSDRHQNNNLKAIISFANFLGPTVSFSSIKTNREILAFLDSKIKSKEEDSDQKWITTWNDYLHRVKHFLRWLKNSPFDIVNVPMEDWKTPGFLQIKEKRSKRISPYLESELWEKEELMTIIKYEPYKRNKAILALLWDLNARPHEITQLKIANYYNAQVLIIPGDLEYSDGKQVLANLQSHGFTKENTSMVVGNHDSRKEVLNWLGNNRTFGEVKFNFSGDKLALFNIDANIKFDCSSPQFEILKSQIESSDALYKFAVVHQPFVTVKSDHPPNGEFDCYDPLFRAGNFDGVLQAHNHNYQRFNINGLLYGIYGTGTHDTGSNMYPLQSTTWEGNDCLQCITGKNGITIIDLQLNNNSKHFVGWFLGMNAEILDDFGKNIP